MNTSTERKLRIVSRITAGLQVAAEDVRVGMRRAVIGGESVSGEIMGIVKTIPLDAESRGLIAGMQTDKPIQYWPTDKGLKHLQRKRGRRAS